MIVYFVCLFIIHLLVCHFLFFFRLNVFIIGTKLNVLFLKFCSDVAEREPLEVNDAIYIETTNHCDDALSYINGDYFCPASPTTVPAFKSRSNSGRFGRVFTLHASHARQWFLIVSFFCLPCISVAGSIRSPRPRRQRTTSINQTKTIDASESIIRANNRTIYTAGRPPWYNCAGQQVEPFVIGLCFTILKWFQNSTMSCRVHDTVAFHLSLSTGLSINQMNKRNLRWKCIW